MPVVLHDAEHTGSTLIRRSSRWLFFFTSANVVHLSPVGTTEAQSKDLKSADLTSQIDLVEDRRKSSFHGAIQNSVKHGRSGLASATVLEREDGKNSWLRRNHDVFHPFHPSD